MTAANATQTATIALGWIGIGLGVALFLWGFTINGRQWWKRNGNAPEQPKSSPASLLDMTFGGSGRGMYVGDNQFIGYSNVSLNVQGDETVFERNITSIEQPSVWQIPTLSDGTSMITRQLRIVEFLLDQWRSVSDRQYSTKKEEMDDAKDFINSQLRAHGEIWAIDDDLQQRLGYGGE